MKGINFHENKKKGTIKNPVAKDLRTPKYKKRVVSDKTKYNRKKVKDGPG